MNRVTAGICSVGRIRITASTMTATVPSFMKVLR